MRIVARRTLRQFWELSPANRAARTPLEFWHVCTKAADWSTPAELKADFGDASILKNGRVVFNIGGNKCRLVARINYHYRVVYIRFVGTHREYDEIDADAI